MLLQELVLLCRSFWLLPCLGSLVVISQLGDFFLFKLCASSPCFLYVHIGLLTIFSGSLYFNQLSVFSSYLILAFFSSYQQVPSWSQYDPWISLFLYSLSHQLSTNYYAQALCQVLGCNGEHDEPLFSPQKHRDYTVHERQFIFPLSVLSLRRLQLFPNS